MAGTATAVPKTMDDPEHSLAGLRQAAGQAAPPDAAGNQGSHGTPDQSLEVSGHKAMSAQPPLHFDSVREPEPPFAWLLVLLIIALLAASIAVLWVYMP